jgi:hypothetical protein
VSLQRRLDHLEKQATPPAVNILFTWQDPTPEALAKVRRWRAAHPERGAAFFWADGDKVRTP